MGRAIRPANQLLCVKAVLRIPAGSKTWRRASTSSESRSFRSMKRAAA
jgi:hypothetical protein